MTKPITGKILLTIAGAFTAISPCVADWNETHIDNPLWTLHAKFHDAQTMLFGAFVGILAVIFGWLPRGQRIHPQVASR